MSKNVVFIPCVEINDRHYKSERSKPYKYGIASWKKWCEKNNCELFVLDEELTDAKYMKPTWQRWYVFDILDLNGVNYDQVAMVDVDTMIRWDAPNFFKLTDRKFSAVVDQDNIGWVKESIDGYKSFFKDGVLFEKVEGSDYKNVVKKLNEMIEESSSSDSE